MSNDPALLSRIEPSAAPTEDELADWLALPREEQVKRISKSLEDGFNAPSASNDIESIIAEARADLGLGSRG